MNNAYSYLGFVNLLLSKLAPSEQARRDISTWLIHAGIEANQPVLESVYGMVAEIRQLRTKAQAMAQQIMAAKSSQRAGEDSSHATA